MTNAFVAYDGADKRAVTLGGGTDGTTIRNVSAGTVNTDAVNVSQLRGIAGTLGGGAAIGTDGKIQNPSYKLGENSYNNVGDALGDLDRRTVENTAAIDDLATGNGIKYFRANSQAADASATGTDSLAAGPSSQAKGKSSTAVGAAARALEEDSAAFGVNAEATAASSTALGGNALASLAKSVAVGNGARAGGEQSTVVGSAAVANSKNAAAMGFSASATAESALAVGASAQASHANAVALGAGSTTSRANSVSVGTAAQTRQITYVGAGTSDTDAVNLKQLKDAGIAVDGGGKVTNAFVAYDGADKAKVSLGGIGGTTLANVKAGVAATDAVNVGQLQSSGIIDDKGNAQKAVLFNGPAGEANAAGKRIVNVAAATAATDAVNLGQLQSTGLVNPDGTILRGVSYAPGSVEAGAPLIALEQGNSKQGTRIQNVAKGLSETDAVNFRQMKDEVHGVTTEPQARLELQPRIAARAATRVAGEADAATKSSYSSMNSYLRAFGRTDSSDGVDASDQARILGDAQLTGGIALGSNGLVEADRGIGIGMQSYVTKAASNGVAIGTGSVANQADTVSVGNDGTSSYEALDANRQPMIIQNPAQTRRIVNMAAGQGDNDAVNVSQLKQVTNAIGGGAAVTGDGSVKAPAFTVGGKTYTNVGEALQAVDSIAATGSPLGIAYDDAGKAKVTLKGEGGTTLSNVKAGTADTDAVNVSQLKSTGLIDGNGNVVPVLTYDDASKSSVTLGGAGSTKPVSIKNVADAVADNDAVNLKQLKSAGLVDGNGSALDAVVYDSGSQKASVTFGGAQGTVLNNVADGQIAAGSRQAVNGGQIASLRDSIKGEIQGLDGRVTKLEGSTGDVTESGPFVSVQGPGPDATTGVQPEERSQGNGSVAVGAGSQATAPASVAVGNGAQVRDGASKSVALGSGSVADRANSVSVGAQGKERTITNVADGTRDTDAVNRRQLEQVAKSANDHTDKRIDEAWGNVRRDMDDMNRQVNRGIAASAALVNVTPYLPGRTAVNAGVASYRGETALGVGVSRWSDNGRVNINAGVSAAKNDEPIYRVGVGFVF